MEIITSLSKTELEQLIFDQVTKCLNTKLPPPQPEISDRCGIDEARIILGTPGKPVSKAKIYQLTNLRKLNFKHFGRSLVFSRRDLIEYRDAFTLPPPSPANELTANLIRSAQKHLRNGK
ncbi:MAG TPA: hypothetical protein DDW27_14755 [Bacteroidales bacterium]|nr:hypothetical protein [Bacteroidales bacterium]